jgi:hypothetical protein
LNEFELADIAIEMGYDVVLLPLETMTYYEQVSCLVFCFLVVYLSVDDGWLAHELPMSVLRVLCMSVCAMPGARVQEPGCAGRTARVGAGQCALVNISCVCVCVCVFSLSLSLSHTHSILSLL